MADYSQPIKNTAFVLDVSLIDAANPTLFKANPTLAAGDVQVRLDDGSLANITTLPTAIGSSHQLKVELSAAETNADRVAVYFEDQAGGEWLPKVVYLYPRTLANTIDLALIDALFARSVSNSEASAAEHSLATLILAALEFSISGTTWTIKRTDGTTTHITKTLTSNAAAENITSVD